MTEVISKGMLCIKVRCFVLLIEFHPLFSLTHQCIVLTFATGNLQIQRRDEGKTQDPQ